MPDWYVGGEGEYYQPPEPEPQFECAWCDGDDSGTPGSDERHHPYCVVAIEDAENARIERLIDQKREGWGIYERGTG